MPLQRTDEKGGKGNGWQMMEIFEDVNSGLRYGHGFNAHLNRGVRVIMQRMRG